MWKGLYRLVVCLMFMEMEKGRNGINVIKRDDVMYLMLVDLKYWLF